MPELEAEYEGYGRAGPGSRHWERERDEEGEGEKAVLSVTFDVVPVGPGEEPGEEDLSGTVSHKPAGDRLQVEEKNYHRHQVSNH